MKNRNFLKTSIIILISMCIANISYGQSIKVKKKKAKHKIHVNHKKHQVNRHLNRPYRYANLPKCGTVINVRPQHGRIIVFRGVNYHFHNGIWYKPRKNKFVVFRPFIGIRIKTLPVNCYQFTLRNRKYHYYYGTYYVHVPKTDEYEVVQPPLGAKIDELPDDYIEKIVNGETYYLLDDVYYSYIENEDLYQVVNPEN